MFVSAMLGPDLVNRRHLPVVQSASTSLSIPIPERSP